MTSIIINWVSLIIIWTLIIVNVSLALKYRRMIRHHKGCACPTCYIRDYNL